MDDNNHYVYGAYDTQLGSLTYERNEQKVYVRRSLSNERILMTERGEPVIYDGLTAIDLLKIIDMAETNVAIRDLLNQLKTMYYLTKDE